MQRKKPGLLMKAGLDVFRSGTRRTRPIAPHIELTRTEDRYTYLNDYQQREVVRAKTNSSTYTPKKATKNRLIVNRRGLFNWDRWDGRVWSPNMLPLYKALAYQRLIARQQRRLRAIRLNLGSKKPQALDTFLLAHHNANLAASLHIDAFYLLKCDIDAVRFVLRTAPTGISNRLKDPLESLDRLSLRIHNNMKDLRIIQGMLAHLPHNPLFFLAQAEMYKQGRVSRAFELNLASELKAYRYKCKQLPGQQFDTTEYDSHVNRIQFKLGNVALSRWNNFKPSSVTKAIRPFVTAVIITMTRMKKAFMLYEIWSRSTSFRFLGRGRRNAESILESASVGRESILTIVEDLAALQYYRIDKFPESFSKQERERSRVLQDQLSAAMSVRSRYK